MRLRIFLFLTVVLLSFAVQLNAQRSRNRVIATDYNECLVGVKDTLGNWIVPATYTSVDYSYSTKGMFVVWHYRKCGLVDSNGVLILPVAYDEITSTDSKGFYIVKNDRKRGVVSNSRDTIVPIIYRGITATKDSVFFARMKKRKWEMYSFTGAKHNVAYKNVYSPYRVGPKLYAARKSKLFGPDKYALINDSGNTVLAAEWNSIYATQNNLIFLRKGEKYGYINYAGATVWPVAYEHPLNPYLLEVYGSDPLYRFSGSNIFNRDTIGVAMLNGKQGLITAGGRTILPFEYDSIGSYSSFARFPYNTIYYVKKEGRYGIFSTHEGWILKPELELLLPLRTYVTSTDSQLVCVFLNKKAGRYGVSSTSGQIVVPCRYQNYAKVTSGLLLYNNDTLVSVDYYPRYLKDLVVQSQLGIPRDSVLPYYNQTPFSWQIPDDKQFAVHTNENGRKIFFYPNGPVKTMEVFNKKFTASSKNNLTTVPDSVLLNAEISVQYILPQKKMDNTHILYVDSTAGWNTNHTPEELYVLDIQTKKTNQIRELYTDVSHTYYRTEDMYLFRDDGVIIVPSNIWEEISVVNNGKEEPLKFLLLSNDSCAVVNSDGTWYIPPFTGSIGFFTEKYIWTSKSVTYPYYKNKEWMLTERATGRTIKWKYDDKNTAIWGNHTTVTTRKQGAQLLNIPRNQIVVSGYNQIEGINREGSLFLVRTCTGKTGIIDSTGKILVDTIYHSTNEVQKTDVLRSFASRNYYSKYKQFYRFYALYNDTGYVVFDADKKSVTGKQMVTGYLKNTLHTVNDSIKPLTLFSGIDYELSTYITAYRADSSRLREWHWNNMTDTLCLPRRFSGNSFAYHEYSRFVYQCEYCYKKDKVRYYRWPHSSANTFIVKHVSDSSLSYYYYNGAAETNVMSNVLLFSNGPRNMTLDSLFRADSDWKNFVINTVISYVNGHLYVRGDCHNPAGFPVMLNERFLLSATGIQLYPEDFTENSRELVITIPWNDAMPYLRDDVKTKLPVKN